MPISSVAVANSHNTNYKLMGELSGVLGYHYINQCINSSGSIMTLFSLRIIPREDFHERTDADDADLLIQR
ncbi:hypothetical protein ACTXT7_000619 [Hymenolepis weldensis]